MHEVTSWEGYYPGQRRRAYLGISSSHVATAILHHGEVDAKKALVEGDDDALAVMVEVRPEMHLVRRDSIKRVVGEPLRRRITLEHDNGSMEFRAHGREIPTIVAEMQAVLAPYQAVSVGAASAGGWGGLLGLAVAPLALVAIVVLSLVDRSESGSVGGAVVGLIVGLVVALATIAIIAHSRGYDTVHSFDVRRRS